MDEKVIAVLQPDTAIQATVSTMPPLQATLENVNPIWMEVEATLPDLYTLYELAKL